MSERKPGDELQIFAFFHYALGAMIGLLALVPAVFLLVRSELGQATDAELVLTDGARAAETFTVSIAIGLVGIGLVLAGLVIAGGRKLAIGRSWTFCVVTSAVLCFLFPLGTLIGAITLFRLFHPPVRAHFNR